MQAPLEPGPCDRIEIISQNVEEIYYGLKKVLILPYYTDNFNDY